MANAAILVGNSQYRTLNDLACCHYDLLAMEELLIAAGRYATHEIIENTDADELKARIRAAIDKVPQAAEPFFTIRVMATNTTMNFIIAQRILILDGQTRQGFQMMSYTPY